MYVSKIVVKGDHENFYEITVDTNDGAQCSCPAYRYGNGKPCKHILFVAKRVVQQK